MSDGIFVRHDAGWRQSRSRCSPPPHPRPRRSRPSPPRWAVGDAATPNDGARRLAAYIRAQRPYRFLYLGDVYEDGTAREFRLHYDPLYGSLARITDPTIGNHEWENRFSGYYPYWRAKKDAGSRWSSTSIAGWQILSLNSMADHRRERSRQLRWLRKQIRDAGRLPHRLLARGPLQRRRVRGRPGDGAALERAPRSREGVSQRPRPQPAADAPLGRHHAVHRGSGRRDRLRGRSIRSATRLGRRPLRALRIALEPGRARPSSSATHAGACSTGAARPARPSRPSGRPRRRVLGERLEVVLEARRRLYAVEPGGDARVLARIGTGVPAQCT